MEKKSLKPSIFPITSSTCRNTTADYDEHKDNRNSNEGKNNGDVMSPISLMSHMARKN